jgi:hypothetical protein
MLNIAKHLYPQSMHIRYVNFMYTTSFVLLVRDFLVDILNCLTAWKSLFSQLEITFKKHSTAWSQTYDFRVYVHTYNYNASVVCL